MLQNERLEMILQILQRRKQVTTGELANSLYISSSTLRRDLMALEKLGKITRRYGNVELVRPATVEFPYLFRQQENEKAKRAIAESCSTFLGDGQALFIDSSSTASFLATYLERLDNMVVITNGLRLAESLDGMAGVKTFITGGRLRPGSGSILGEVAVDFLDNFRADLAIISCTGITADGIFMSSEEQSSIKRKMLGAAKSTLVLADHTKVGQQAYYRLCAPGDVSAIITDVKPPADILAAWAKADVETLY
ncbi:DeoR/GlpR family DNA-binding transcription regulator [Lacticaseibacillus yichunensis]|uniref:Lactose phosphotransferase system repressor n=1 Tax=Lacticaseibacillus yichunensis TaxID=2486015 RepID=A0ABW4CP97_9LACO|nr:DeoR/GlpR family DNA-binding transcription regulator [Lacticaseibacillus yichunensis]